MKVFNAITRIGKDACKFCLEFRPITLEVWAKEPFSFKLVF